MRVVFLVVAMAWFAWVVPSIWRAACGERTVEAPYIGLATAVLLAGTFCLLCGIRRYRGGWPTLIGIVSLVLAAWCASWDLLLYLVDPYHSDLYSVGMFGAFALIGVLLVASGHTLHRCTVALGERDVTVTARPESRESSTLGRQMRIVFYIVGIACFARPVSEICRIVTGQYHPEGTHIGTLTALLLAGAAFLFCGVKNYRGGWPTAIGIASALLAALGVNEILAVYLTDPYYHEPFGNWACAAFALVGILLVLSGHTLHNRTKELEGGTKRTASQQSVGEATSDSAPSAEPEASQR